MARTLDPQARELIDTLDDQGVLPTHALSVPTARRKLEDLFTPSGDPEPVGDVIDLATPGPDSEIPLRIYRPDGQPPWPVTVYFHGGGWTLGGLDAYDGTCRRLTNAAECIVVSVDYRLAPEHPFPAAFEDAYAAVEWTARYASDMHGDPDRIGLAGDSAGGNLAAACALATRDRDGPALAHQALLYPALNPPDLRWMDSYDENREGYFLELDSMRWFYDKYVPRPADRRNAYAFPLLARDLSGLPPTTVLTCEFDPLRDEGAAYADRLDEAGVPVNHTTVEGMIHGFVSLREHIDRGADGVEIVATGLRESLAR